MSERIVKHISFSVSKRPMGYRPRVVYELICHCLNNKIVLDDYILLDWWMEKIVKPRNRYVSGESLGKGSDGYYKFERVKEYDWKQKQITEHGGMLPGYFWAEAKSILKYHIGNLVINGYLVVLPVIKITPYEENKREIQ
jgi:hypothetical protein